MSLDANPNKSALPAFYFFGAVREIIPIYPLYAIMFGERGISPFELSLLFVIWSGSVLILEIPSGALADRFSRKWLIVASGFIKACAYLTWYFEQHFWGFAAGFILWGLASSLRSGAWEALLYDILKSNLSENLFTRHHGRITAFATSGAIIGEFLGGLLILNGYQIVLIVSAIVPIVATLPFVLWVQDVAHTTNNEEEEAEDEQSYTQLLASGLSETGTNPRLLFILAIFMFLISGYGIYDEYVPPLLNEIGFDLSTVAFITASIGILAALGEFFADRLSQFKLPSILTLMLVSSLLLLTTYWLSGYGFAIAMLIGIYFGLFSTAHIQLDARIQESIDGKARATVTSIMGFGLEAGAIFWYLAFGLLAELSFALATAVFALTSTLLIIIFLLFAKRF